MSLDHLASSATRELLQQVPPDAEWMLDELKRTRRQRVVTRYAAAAAAAVLVAGSWTLLQSGEDRPEPAEPATVRNGAIVAPPDTTAGAWSEFTAFGIDLHLPEDAVPFARASFTADGSDLIYPGPAHTMRAIDVATGESTMLALCLDDHCHPSISPDGTRLAYGAEEHVKIQTIATRDAEAILTPGAKWVWMPTWSPDGSTLAFTGPRGLYTVDVVSGAVRQLHRSVGRRWSPTAASWSPDGQTIAFLDQQPRRDSETSFTVTTVAADGTDVQDIHGAGHCACLGLPAPSLTWSPDGELIAVAVTQGEDGAGIYTVRPNGSGWRLVHGGVYGDVDWQPIFD